MTPRAVLPPRWTQLAAGLLLGIVAAAGASGCEELEPAGPYVGECEEGSPSHCVGRDEIQHCDGGEWTEPAECPDFGDPPFAIETICEAGDCHP